jgi:hypothetical protein
MEIETAELEQELSAQHASLVTCVEGLREEVLTLRTEILRHGDCECAMIQQYIAASARQVSYVGGGPGGGMSSPAHSRRGDGGGGSGHGGGPGSEGDSEAGAAVDGQRHPT